MKYIILTLLSLSLIVGLKIYDTAYKKDVDFDMGTMTIIKKSGQELKIKLKVADTINERAKGLMYVKEMPEGEGMLFVFETEEMRRMWMENTYIPLDMLFVDKDKTIFNYKENATPLSRDIIYSVGPAKYVVELNAGFVKSHGIGAGDKIEYETE